MIDATFHLMLTDLVAAHEQILWSSAHLHVNAAGLSDLDKCVSSFVSPFVSSGLTDGWLRRAFFVRYGEGGPHVRLRMEPTADTPLNQVHEAVADAVRRYNDRNSEPLYLRWKPYEPEVARYGGPDALGHAEAFFCESSAVAFSLLQHENGSPWSQPQRLGQGLLLMVVMAHTVAPTCTASSKLLQFYGESYLRTFARDTAADAWYNRIVVAFGNQEAMLIEYVRETWIRLVATERLTAALDRYRSATAAYVSGLQKVHARRESLRPNDVVPPWGRLLRHCVPSLMHMTSNRLGVSVVDEVYLALLAHRSLTALTSSEGAG